jgi:hypothetical protein
VDVFTVEEMELAASREAMDCALRGRPR